MANLHIIRQHLNQALAILDGFPEELEHLSPRDALAVARQLPAAVTCLRRMSAAMTEPEGTSASDNIVIADTQIDAANLVALALEMLENIRITPEDSQRTTIRSEISLIRVRSLLIGTAALLNADPDAAA